MAKPYSLFLKGSKGKRILHTNLIFYHLPIACSLITALFANLTTSEWLLVCLVLAFGVLIYPVSFWIRKNKVVTRLHQVHVKDKDVNRVSAALVLGFIDLLNIIFAIISTIAFFTLLIYLNERPVNPEIQTLNSAIHFSLSALGVQGTSDTLLQTGIGKTVSVILWAISQVLLAIVLGFWIHSFRHIFVSFRK